MKKLSLTLSTLLFLIASAYSQDANTDKVQFGFSVYANHSNHIERIDTDVPLDPVYANQVDVFGKPSISAQVFSEVSLRPSWSISIGLGYQNTGLRTGYILPVMSTTEPELTFERIVMTQHNLELPINAKCHFNNRWYGLIGISGLLNLYNSGSSHTSLLEPPFQYDVLSLDHGTARKFNVQLNAGFGFEKELSSESTLFFQPYCQFNLLSTSNPGPIKHHMYSFGVGSGFRI